MTKKNLLYYSKKRKSIEVYIYSICVLKTVTIVTIKKRLRTIRRKQVALDLQITLII